MAHPPSTSKSKLKQTVQFKAHKLGDNYTRLGQKPSLISLPHCQTTLLTPAPSLFRVILYGGAGARICVVVVVVRDLTSHAVFKDAAYNESSDSTGWWSVISRMKRRDLGWTRGAFFFITKGRNIIDRGVFDGSFPNTTNVTFNKYIG